MKNILIPTDFSENSWNAVTYALSFYRKESCTFYLLHVIDVMVGAVVNAAFDTPLQEIDHERIAASETKLMKLYDRVISRELNPHHTIKLISETDTLVECIRKSVVNYHIDLIVMGTRGADGIREKTIGTHTVEVLTRVKCPLLIVPREACYSKLREVVFPTDYRMPCTTGIAELLKKLILLDQVPIRFLHIVKKHSDLLSVEQELNKITYSDNFKDFENSFHTLTNHNLELAVECFTESRDISLIVMVAKNLNFFQQILFNPRVAEISYHTRIPFLVLHEV
ncbi:universal stress protein [Robertkochia solimangrovi]|uniref:universal stress protein n=1 Tax=Robertkochia solimangrovi TaxID=2213046 RepID=UPI00117CA239|nr:universal stress protein [Robertkochia solimangrovi]TRZ41257.1 universal stress protein [Robertkochia solimangrovi]